MGEIKVLNMINGLNLLGEISFDKIKVDVCRLKNVVEVREIVVPPNTEGGEPEKIVQFLPFLPFTTAMEEVEINFNNVLLTTNPIPSILEGYQRQFGKVITNTKKVIT